MVKDSDGYEITLIASGSEVNLCYAISEILEGEGKKPELYQYLIGKKFLKQDYQYIKHTLGDKLRVILEAGTPDGWYWIAGDNSIIIGVEDFGFSGDGNKLAKLYGFDEVKIAEKIIDRLKG